MAECCLFHTVAGSLLSMVQVVRVSFGLLTQVTPIFVGKMLDNA